MAYGRSKRANHLKIVSESESRLAAVISTARGREQVNELTQQLVDVLIEMMDLTDGDPDGEPTSDDFDDDGGSLIH